LTLLHLRLCHNCESENDYHTFTAKVDPKLDIKALKALDSILHDVEDIMIEEAAASENS